MSEPTTGAPSPLAEALSAGTVWDGAALRITDPQLLAVVDRPYLSASTAASFRSCPARLVADRIQSHVSAEVDIFSPAEIGSAGHLVLEGLYELPPGQRDRKNAAKLLVDLVRNPRPGQEVNYADALGGDADIYAQWVGEVMTSIRGIFDIEDPDEVEVWATEYRLEGIEVGGVPIKGFIDRIDVTDKGLALRDHKSGRDRSRPNKHFADTEGDQMRLYHAALQAATGERPGGGASLYYTRHGKVRRVAVGKTDVNKTLAEFARTWDEFRHAIDTATFAAKPSALCGWCPLANSCPVARPAKSDKDPREFALSKVELGIPVVRAPSDAELAGAAHRGSASTPADHAETLEDTVVTRTQGAREEAKPWEATVGGELNLNSYAATATIGLASLAAELLSENDQKVGPATVGALAGQLAKVVLTAQGQITGGSQDWSEGVNTRLRGALRTVVGIVPVPFGGDADAWQNWSERAVRFATAIVTTGISLFEGNLPDDLTPLLPETAQAAA